MVVQYAHGATEHPMVQRVVVAVAAPICSDHVMQIERERRCGGLAGPNLARHVQVAPGGVDDGLVQEQIELRLGDALARQVRRLRRHFEIGQVAVERGHLPEQQIAQGRGGRGNGECVAH